MTLQSVELATEITDDLSARAEAGDQDAVRALNEILDAFASVEEAKDELRRASKEAKEREEQEFAAVKNAIEDSLPTGSGAQVVASKLSTIESAWQDYQEAIAHGVEEKKYFRDAKKEAELRFRKALTESKQLSLNLGP